MPSTVEDLADLDEGLILILGTRRSGKSIEAARILERWSARGLSYKHFSPQSDHYRTTRTVTRHYGGNPERNNILHGSRGYRFILVDEPGIDVTWQDFNPGGILVLVTSEPQEWMVKSASWISKVFDPYSQPMGRRIDPGPFATTPLRPPVLAPTIWERLLASV